MSQSLPHNYEAAVRKFAEENHVPPGRLSELAIRHDDWCGLLQFGSRCDCEPLVELMKTHGDAPEGPPNKLRPGGSMLWVCPAG